MNDGWHGAWWKWIVTLLAFLEAGWITFDGIRALVTGSYTLVGGQRAGQLGPWANVVSVIGISPHSIALKWVFTIYGVSWIAIVVCFMLDLRWARFAMLTAAIGLLWYLPFGTLLSVLQIVLILYNTRR